jgi:hypothetical protein
MKSPKTTIIGALVAGLIVAQTYLTDGLVLDTIHIVKISVAVSIAVLGYLAQDEK